MCMQERVPPFSSVGGNLYHRSKIYIVVHHLPLSDHRDQRFPTRGSGPRQKGHKINLRGHKIINGR